MRTRKNYASINSENPNTFCMDVEGGIRKNNTPIISYHCHGGPNQKFKYNNKTKQIKSKYTKKCLDIVKNRIVQKKCNSRRKTQKWVYKKKNWVSLANRKCVDIAGEQWDNGVLITYPCHNRANQKWVNSKK